METLFNQFVVVCRLDETVSYELFADQNAVLTLCKHADNKFTVDDIFEATELRDCTNRDTWLRDATVVARDDDAVFNELFVVQ